MKIIKVLVSIAVFVFAASAVMAQQTNKTKTQGKPQGVKEMQEEKKATQPGKPERVKEKQEQMAEEKDARKEAKSKRKVTRKETKTVTKAEKEVQKEQATEEAGGTVKTEKPAKVRKQKPASKGKTVRKGSLPKNDTKTKRVDQ